MNLERQRAFSVQTQTQAWRGVVWVLEWEDYHFPHLHHQPKYKQALAHLFHSDSQNELHGHAIEDMVNTRDVRRHTLFCVFYIVDMRGYVSEAQDSDPLVFRRVQLACS